MTLLPVVDRQTAGDWIARAHVLTVRRLTDEVNHVLDARDVCGPGASLGPPPLDSVLVSPARTFCGDAPSGDAPGSAPRGNARCRKMSPGASVHIGAASTAPGGWTRNGTGARTAADVCDGEIRFTGPASVVALFRDALDAFAHAGEPRWVAVERLLTRVIADWEAAPGHRDPVFARDAWRCAVPACSARRNLHDHHLHFRSTVPTGSIGAWAAAPRTPATPIASGAPGRRRRRAPRPRGFEPPAGDARALF